MKFKVTYPNETSHIVFIPNVEEEGNLIKQMERLKDYIIREVKVEIED
jgi:hypothetical protein